MRGRLFALVVSMLALLATSPAVSAGSTVRSFTDVPTSFWAHGSVLWAVQNGWMIPRGTTTFGTSHYASRVTASRVLAQLNRLRHGIPVSATPYQQAVASGWIDPGKGTDDTITQWEFDRGVVRVMGLREVATMIGQLHTTDGWRPTLPIGFGVEQTVRAIGARVDVPAGSDVWEEWPMQTLRRADLAADAYRLAHLSPWAVVSAQQKAVVGHALPPWTPLKRAVLGFALRYAGSPYVWGGESPSTNSPYGPQAAGGFDCSGFVWWVMKMQTYHVGALNWSGNAAVQWRTTYDMAAHIPVAKRIPRTALHPGDILFWSSAPDGVATAWSTVYHTGIYLGNGWTINSHGSGAGVTLDYMGTGAGWYHDAFAFGWRVMPLGK
jgi:NlpC/P60 family